MKTNAITTSLQRDEGFSLVETSIAIAIAAVILIATMGLLPGILKNQRDSQDHTAIGTIYEDVHDRLEGLELKAGVPPVSPLYYDVSGVYWDPKNENTTPEDRFFQVDIKLVEPENSTTPTPPGMAAKLSVYWPLNELGTIEPNQKPRSKITYFVTTLTGPDWEEIDPDFTPKIEN